MSTLLIIIAIVLVAICLWSWIQAELYDVDVAVLQNQTSVSETRKEGESAVYRSVDVPHGAPLTAGLSIQVGYQLRDGCLKDIWRFSMDGQNTQISWMGNKSYTTRQFNAILHQIAAYLQKLGVQSRDGSYPRVAVCVRSLFESPAAMAFILSAFFVSEITIVNYTGPITSLPEDIDTVLVDEFAARYVQKLNVKNVITTGTFDGCVSFSDIVDLENAHDELNDFAYKPSTDYKSINNQPYSEILNGREVKFFQRNFVATVAAKLMSLHHEYTWNSNDSLVILGAANFIQNRNLIHTVLCGFLSDVKRIKIANHSQVATLDELAQLKPTILSTTHQGLSQLIRSGKKHIKKSFILQRAEYFNSHGMFCKFGRLEKSLDLKMAYVSQYDDHITSSNSTNLARSVLGCRIIRETFMEYSLGPILKTNLLDYRISTYGQYQLLGVPANCTEAKVIFPSENAKIGTLFIRGMALGKLEGAKSLEETEGWVECGFKGRFASDGCFYGSCK